MPIANAACPLDQALTCCQLKLDVECACLTQPKHDGMRDFVAVGSGHQAVDERCAGEFDCLILLTDVGMHAWLLVLIGFLNQ